MIEDVEEYAPKAKLHSFRQMKLTLETNVRLGGSETAQHVTPEISLLAGGRRGECINVKYLTARILRTVEFQWYTGNDIWSCEQ
jgi:hypothetical protein